MTTELTPTETLIRTLIVSKLENEKDFREEDEIIQELKKCYENNDKIYRNKARLRLKKLLMKIMKTI